MHRNSASVLVSFKWALVLRNFFFERGVVRVLRISTRCHASVIFTRSIWAGDIINPEENSRLLLSCLVLIIRNLSKTTIISYFNRVYI